MSSLSERIDSVTTDLNSLITYANETTGESDTTMSDAVGHLVDGYGGGSGSSDEKAIVERTITSYSNDEITTVGDYAFSYCSVLTSVDCPNVTSVKQYAFRECSALETVNLPKSDLNASMAFTACKKLKNINAPLAEKLGNYLFWNCVALTSLVFPKVTLIYSNVFSGCTNLATLDLAAVAQIQDCFTGCSGLTSLILRGNSVCSYTNTNSTHDPTNANLKIYVPSDLLSSYQTATNWSRLASHFVSLDELN